MRINLPRLLNSSMSVKERLHPTKTSIKRNLYSLHTASITLPPGEPAVKERDWIALFDRYGSAGIFRVSRMRTAYGRQNELSLKHGFCVLEDDTVKSTDCKGSGTAVEVMRHLFSCAGVVNAPQYWTLGSFAQTPVIEYEYSNVKLSDAVWDVIRKVPGYAFTFDQSHFPWVLGLIRLSDADACEGRFGRNLDSCVVEMDDSSICTRAYLDDRDGYTEADTVSVWGVASHTLTVPEGAEQADIDAYVSAYLNEHKNPRITISLNAADMSDATGETLDRFQLGAVCRACLPEYKTTVRERIVSLTSPDVYGDPDRVEIAMANRMETASDLLAKLNKNTSALASASTVTNRRIGGVSKKVEETDIELIRQNQTIEDTRIRMAKAGIVIDKDAEFVKAFAYSETVEGLDRDLKSIELLLHGETGSGGLVASVQTAETAIEEIVGSTLWLNRNSITGIVGNFSIDSDGNVVVNDGTGFMIQRGNATFGVYDAGNLTAGLMVQKINDESSVIINADRVALGGYVTTGALDAEMAIIENVFAGYSEISALGIKGNLYAANARFTDNVSLLERVCNWTTVTMGDVAEHTMLGAGTNKTLDLAHSHAVTVDDDGTITLGEVSSSGGTFKIADTTYYKNGVSASYNKGKTDWSPVEIQRTGYSTADKTVTTRAVNAAGVPLIALEDIDASEIFDAGAQSVIDEVVIGCDQPSSIIHIGNNVYQMRVRIWAKYNGDTIQATTVTLSKGLYN